MRLKTDRLQEGPYWNSKIGILPVSYLSGHGLYRGGQPLHRHVRPHYGRDCHGPKKRSCSASPVLISFRQDYNIHCFGRRNGVCGSFTRVTDFMLNLQHIILVGTGFLIIIMGLTMMGAFPSIRFLDSGYTGGGFVAQRFKKIIQSDKTVSYLPMGLLLGFLPCGPVYVALTAAAGTGMNAQSPVRGMLSGMIIMACFGIGTARHCLCWERSHRLK